MAKIFRLCLLLFIIFTGQIFGGDMSIQFADLSNEDAGTVEAKIPWVKADGLDLRAGKPAFTRKSETTELAVKGWMAASAKGLHLAFDVTDSVHQMPVDSGQLWTGDGIEIALDGRGDRTGSLPESTSGGIDVDDFKLMLAIAPKGPAANVMVGKPKDRRGPLPKEFYSIERKGDITSYTVCLEWKWFNTVPGSFPAFGLCVQVNDSDPERKEREMLLFGDGVYGAIQPAKFARMAIENPTDEIAGLTIEKALAWSTTDAARIRATVRSPKEHTVTVEFAGETKTQTIPASDTVRRVAIDLMPPKGAGLATPVKVTLAADGKTVDETTTDIVLTQNVFDELVRKLDVQIAKAEHPLFKRHWMTIKAIATYEWALMPIHMTTAERGKPIEVFGYFKKLLDGLEGPALDWNQYKNAKRSLFIGRISPVDRTHQFCVLTLPQKWDPEKEYPLFVELHGAGSDIPMAGVAANFGKPGSKLQLHGYESVLSYSQTNGGGYHIAPFGRGNLGYRGPGESDVWEAYEEVHKLFKIDPNRRYLFGFSMGGGGTWSLGLRTPDQWAAVAILAGGTWRENNADGLAKNIAKTPVFMFCGENDSLFPQLSVMKNELEKYGNTPKVVTVPNLGHNYTADIQKESTEWLKTHVRKRPDTFAYVSNDNLHRGAWGIVLERDVSINGLPSFNCKIEKDTVHVDTKGTSGLTVDLTEAGLDMKGEVTLKWNGREVYKGEPKKVYLGTAELKETDAFRRRIRHYGDLQSRLDALLR